MGVERAGLIHEGKSKRVWATSDPDRVVLEFKDDATAFDGRKHALIADKAAINCAVSARLFERVGAGGVANHVVSRLSGTELLCERVQVLPVEVVVRNVCAGSLARRYGLPEGERLRWPLVEWFHKSDALGDPLVGADAVVLLGWMRPWELRYTRDRALRVNALLGAFWAEHGIDLVDLKLEFGRATDGRLLLADELTPDGARLWDRETGRPLDKDVFRRDLADLSETYKALYARVFGRPFARREHE